MKRRLTKSNTNVVLTGTLGGLGEYLGIDPTIIRVIYVFLSLFALGSPIILYILMAILIPSGKNKPGQGYGHQNPYYQKNDYRKDQTKRKEAEKIDDDDWSDF